MFIVFEIPEIPHSFRSAMLIWIAVLNSTSERNMIRVFGTLVTAEHCTPKGVRNFTMRENYKHATPNGVKSFYFCKLILCACCCARSANSIAKKQCRCGMAVSVRLRTSSINCRP